MSEPFTTERRLELWDAGPIWEKLPVKFSNGKSWRELHACCPTCRNQILDEDFCGDVRETFADIFRLEAVGHCWHCRNATIAIWDIKSDIIKARMPDGSWVIFQDRRTAWTILKSCWRILTGRRS